MQQTSAEEIAGRTAEEIAASVRGLLDRGILAPGASLPPVRALAESLGVNRNTALAGYRLLVRAGLAETRRGGGTVLAAPAAALPEEGFAPVGAVAELAAREPGRTRALRDVGDGNPDPALLPDPLALRLEPAPPRLYGEATIDPGLAAWATEWIAEDQSRPFALTVTAGAVDAVERLLAVALAPGDAVALEDPCFLTSISTVRQGGYRPIGVGLDGAGMRPDELRAALEAGARAVVCTPRAHNPTGVSLTQERAAELRAVLADFPHVLVIEDDHFALLARASYATIIGADHPRWALVRSVSKVLGPDLRLALVASDAGTAAQLGLRISGGITWVSHLLQRMSHGLLAAPGADAQRAAASAHYAERAASFAERLRRHGCAAVAGDGLNVWVATGAPAAQVLGRLGERGWLARPGAEFALAGGFADFVRVTAHALDDPEQEQLAADLAWAAGRSAPG